ncbi:MAG: hypothetical protein EOP86_26540, partial [Verrucomicrobiaceae bacterium]
DHDGLNDKAEQSAGTNPLEPDTDGDGFLDSLEVAKGSNPKDNTSAPPPASALVMHYHFNDSVADQSGFGNNGTLVNDAVYSDDVPAALPVGKSLQLLNDGGTEKQGVTIAANPLLNSRLFTLAYWIKPTSAQTGALDRLTGRAAFGFETAVGNASSVGGTTSPSGITLSYYIGSGAWNVTNVEIIENEWVHAAWVSSDAQMDLYLNGELAYSGPAALDTTPGQGSMTIGTSYLFGEGFEGFMDDFSLYAAALSAADVAAIAGSVVVPVDSIQFTGFTRSGDGSSVSLAWNSKGGRTYALDYSTDLKTWLGVNGNISSGGDTTTFSDTVFPPLNQSKLFYRVRQN